MNEPTGRFPTPQELRATIEAAFAAGEYDRPTEWETAFHEAGHVVVEVATGSYPDSVYLNDGLLAGDDHGGRTSTRSFIGVEHLGDQVRRRCAAVLAAGQLAAGIARGVEVDVDDEVPCIVEGVAEGTDARALHGLVEGLAPGPAETWLEDAFGEAERLLRERWADVERVAVALVKRRHLSREDLWDLLEDVKRP